MSRSREARYAPTNGQIVFGQQHISVRWNRHSLFLSIESTEGGSIILGPEDNSPAVLLALAKSHREGRLIAFLREAFSPTIPHLDHRFYLCNTLWCYRPHHQETLP